MINNEMKKCEIVTENYPEADPHDDIKAPLSPADDDALARVIAEKKNVFHLLDAIIANLKAHSDDPVPNEATRNVLNMLNSAAKEPVASALSDAQSNMAPNYYVCTGQEANWLWVNCMLEQRIRTRLAFSASDVVQLCEELRSDLREGATGDTEHAVEIIESLEARFGYLSRVIGALGLHFVSFPTVYSEKDYNFHHVVTSDLCVISIRQFPAIRPNEPADNQDYCVYLSAAEAIADAFDLDDNLPEDAVSLMERSTVSNIRSLAPEDQVLCFHEALLMGLSYHAPYGDFPDYRYVPDDLQRAWHNYIARLINPNCEVVD